MTSDHSKKQYPSPKSGPPYSGGTRVDPKANETYSPLTESNRSPQTPQAAAQHVPQGRESTTAGARVIAGAGSKMRVVKNGRMAGRFYSR